MRLKGKKDEVVDTVYDEEIALPLFIQVGVQQWIVLSGHFDGKLQFLLHCN